MLRANAVMQAANGVTYFISSNKPLLLGFLFKSTSQTLLRFGENPANGLGGRLGMIAILHTWTQTLMDHFHLHCLVPGGVLADDRYRYLAMPLLQDRHDEKDL